MQISKLSFTSQTRELLSNPGLDYRKRRELKKERVLEFIRQSDDNRATMRDLAAAAGYHVDDPVSYSSGYQFVRTLMRNGVIVTFDKGVYSKQWAIPGDTDIEIERNLRAVEKLRHRRMHISGSKPTLSEIREKAKEFAWTHNSDSLRDFIEWLEKLGGNSGE